MSLWKTTIPCAALAAVGILFPPGALAQEYQLRVLADGLQQPNGIAVNAQGDLFFTQLPTPGVPGPAGGMNRVSRRDGRTGAITTLTLGEPEPTHIVVDRRETVYWTCKSAGVILRLERGATAANLVLGGLQSPSGIAVDQHGRDRGGLYWTEIPTPGVAGGGNGVFRLDGVTPTRLSMGEPEPTDIVVDQQGTLYWTCKSAGVILAQHRGRTRVLLAGLNHPQGIALDGRGNLYFTEVPTPGVPGTAGGNNKVWKYDLRREHLSLVHAGDPEPADVAALPNGVLYWTCKSAGVIVVAVPSPRSRR